MDSDDVEVEELRNPFPSPPSHYSTYTSHNMTLLSLLQQRTADDSSPRSQQVVLSDQNDVPEWPLINLLKPRVDWILEDGEFMVFGERWDVCNFFVRGTFVSILFR
jgi:mediator of RNA polymerase II transcription subunit 7